MRKATEFKEKHVDSKKSTAYFSENYFDCFSLPTDRKIVWNENNGRNYNSIVIKHT